MKRKTAAILWPVVALATMFLLGLVVATSRRPDPGQVEVVTRGPSAAASISLVLFGTLGLMVLMAVGAVAVALVIRARQHTMQMEKAALLFGVQKPQPQQPQRRPQVQSGEGVSVVIVGGQGGGVPRVEDFRNGYNG